MFKPGDLVRTHELLRPEPIRGMVIKIEPDFYKKYSYHMPRLTILWSDGSTTRDPSSYVRTIQ